MVSEAALVVDPSNGPVAIADRGNLRGSSLFALLRCRICGRSEAAGAGRNPGSPPVPVISPSLISTMPPEGGSLAPPRTPARHTRNPLLGVANDHVRQSQHLSSVLSHLPLRL